MRMTLSLILLCCLAGTAVAHVSGVAAGQHAAEHAWLALLLLPAGVVGVRALARRRRR